MSTTASKIITDTANGHHLLKIEGFSASGTLSGQRIESLPFTVGGHRWSLWYYPNGFSVFGGRYVSLYLVLKDHVAKPVWARVRFDFAADAEEEVEVERPPRCLPCFPKEKSQPSPLFKSGDLQFQSYGVRGCQKLIKRKDLEKSRHFRGDSFTIRCDIVVINGFPYQEAVPAAKTSAPRAFVAVPPPDLGGDLQGLLQTGSGADVTFEVGGETFAAHRWLLAARSPAFSAEVHGPTTQESGGVVRVNKMEPRVFKALLSFMYTDSLSLPETMTKQEEAAFSQHLLVAAHRYGMERLKLLCEESLCRSIEVGTAANLLALAEQLGCRGLKDACFDFLGSSPANLNAVVSFGFRPNFLIFVRNPSFPFRPGINVSRPKISAFFELVARPMVERACAPYKTIDWSLATLKRSPTPLYSRRRLLTMQAEGGGAAPLPPIFLRRQSRSSSSFSYFPSTSSIERYHKRRMIQSGTARLLENQMQVLALKAWKALYRVFELDDNERPSLYTVICIVNSGIR